MFDALLLFAHSFVIKTGLSLQMLKWGHNSLSSDPVPTGKPESRTVGLALVTLRFYKILQDG